MLEENMYQVNRKFTDFTLDFFRNPVVYIRSRRIAVKRRNLRRSK